ncbi:SDR family oxidoreductase [Peribacillus cavernae]|uniref:SDR family oxidoreductase n=1 Tax=Peribacillus cavernae TaxID=1674310 RepID=A0A433HJB1_9BACI|nr:SDR family NAD(P)-dependent oxidoreductase [Peribacillus cavernae]MDQ0217692.1 NAD(P)-dependent dehydrogenase (short-subunit alcohol dehydrogenase family) [Peribacillus cavernae]RUQ28162.1 SDR family oxidoreductase [Peribacillus cavernae]
MIPRLDKDWGEQVAVVTGAGSTRGIGRETALHFGRLGASVVAIDRDPIVGEVAAQIRAEGSKAIAITLDVTKDVEIQRALDQVLNEFGHIDILVNNAGITRPNSILNISRSEWELVLATDLTSSFVFTQEVLPAMMKRKYGRIINLSSISGERGGVQNGCHYSAAKAGVMGLTKHVAREMGGYGITCNAVSPGLIETDFGGFTEGDAGERRALLMKEIPAGRSGSAEEVAATICFLASPAAGYITGEIVDVNGGWHID